MNRQRWLRTRRRLKERRDYFGEWADLALDKTLERRDRAILGDRRFEELMKVLPKPYADYLPDMPWENRS